MRKFLSLLTALAVAFTLSVPLAASAQTKASPKPTEIIVNKNEKGVEVAFSRVEGKQVVAYDVVSAWNEQSPLVADCGKYKASFKGATWCFVNEANKTAFVKALTVRQGHNKYVPAFGGRCALGTSWSMLNAKGDPRTARILNRDGRQILVLQSQQRWWATFADQELMRLLVAQLNYQTALRTGHIVPNEPPKPTMN